MSATKSTLCVAVLVVSAATNLHAQEARKLDTVVVVGSRVPTEISQIPAAVWVVEKEELQAQVAAGAGLKTALGRLVPGLDLAPEGRTNFGQNLRGRDALVLIDGVSLNNTRGISRQFDSIDPFNIERIEVLSGASSLYGGGATGGIINIVTRKGEADGLHGRSEARLTSGFNRRDDLDTRLAQSVSGGSERVQGYLGAAWQDNGRWFDAQGSEIFPDLAQTDLQDNRSLDLLGNLSFTPDADQTIQLGAQLYRSGYEGDRGVYFPNLAAATPNLNQAEIRDGFRSDREPTTDRKMLTLQYHHARLLGQSFYLQGFYRQEEASFQGFPYRVTGGYEFRASQQNTELSGMKALFDAKLSKTLGLTYGVDVDREGFDADQMYFSRPTTNASGGLVQQEARVGPRYPSFDVSSIAAYGQGNWPATPGLKFAGGVRRQQTQVEVAEFNGIPGGANDYAWTLGNLSALYDYGNGHQNWLRYSQGVVLLGTLLYVVPWNPVFGATAAKPSANTAATRDARVGFLIVAPDRGFLGNEEIRDAYESFARGHNAALAVVTDERTRATLGEALESLARRGARRTVVLPLFFSPNEPRLALARSLLAERDRTASPISFARTFGESYFAVEALTERLRALPDPQGRRVIVAGYGARSSETRRQLEADWRRLAEHAARGLAFESVRALVWYDATGPDRTERHREMQAALAQAASAPQWCRFISARSSTA